MDIDPAHAKVLLQEAQEQVQLLKNIFRPLENAEKLLAGLVGAQQRAVELDSDCDKLSAQKGELTQRVSDLKIAADSAKSQAKNILSDAQEKAHNAAESLLNAAKKEADSLLSNAKSHLEDINGKIGAAESAYQKLTQDASVKKDELEAMIKSLGEIKTWQEVAATLDAKKAELAETESKLASAMEHVKRLFGG